MFICFLAYYSIKYYCYKSVQVRARGHLASTSTWGLSMYVRVHLPMYVHVCARMCLRHACAPSVHPCPQCACMPQTVKPAAGLRAHLTV